MGLLSIGVYIASASAVGSSVMGKRTEREVLFVTGAVAGTFAIGLGILNGVVSGIIAGATGGNGGAGFVSMIVGIFGGTIAWNQYYQYDPDKADETAEAVEKGIETAAEKTAKTAETIEEGAEKLERKAEEHQKKKKKKKLKEQRKQAIKHAVWKMNCPECGQVWTRSRSRMPDVPEIYGMRVVGIHDTLNYVQFQCLQCNQTQKVKVSNVDLFRGG